MARQVKWSIPVGKIMEEINEQHRKLAIAAALEVYSRLIIRSPVGDPSKWKYPAPAGYVGGAFRSNWMIESGSEPVGFNPTQTSMPTAGVSGLKHEIGQTISIRNNAPYSVALEFGHSLQAPSPPGMVRLSASEWPEIVREVGAGLAKGTV